MSGTSIQPIHRLKLELILGHIVAPDPQQLGDAAPAIATFYVKQEVNRVAHIAADRPIGKLNAGLQNAVYESRNRLFGVFNACKRSNASPPRTSPRMQCGS